MEGNSRIYQSEIMSITKTDSQERRAAIELPLQILDRGQRDETMFEQASQPSRCEGWEQGVSYTSPNADTLPNNSIRSLHEPLGHRSNLSSMQRVRLDYDKLPIRKSINGYQHIGDGSVACNRQHLAARSSLDSRQTSSQAKTLPTYPRPRVSPHSYHSLPIDAAIGEQFSQVNKSIANQDTNTHMEANALLKAVSERDRREIERLLDNGTNVNSVETGQTALHLAAQMADIDTIGYLLRRGANVTLRDRLGYTAEHYARTNNISVESMLQTVHLSTKPRSMNLSPSALDWRQSFTGETIVPTVASYSLDMHQSLALQQYQAYEDTVSQYLSPFKNNAWQDTNRLEPGHVAYNKLSHSKHPEASKPSQYDQNCFSSPFKPVRRPAQNNNSSMLSSVFDSEKQRTSAGNKILTSSNVMANGDKFSRASQSIEPPKSSSGRVQRQTALRKNFKTVSNLYSPKKFTDVSQTKKLSSFLIDDLAKPPSAKSKRTEMSESELQAKFSSSIQQLSEHVQLPFRMNQNSVSSPFYHDFHKFSGHNFTVPVTQLTGQLTTTSPFSPYHVAYNSEMTYPISSVRCNPYTTPPPAIEIADPSDQLNVNHRDTRSTMQTSYESSSDHGTLSNQTANETVDPGYQNPSFRHESHQLMFTSSVETSVVHLGVHNISPFRKERDFNGKEQSRQNRRPGSPTASCVSGKSKCKSSHDITAPYRTGANLKDRHSHSVYHQQATNSIDIRNRQHTNKRDLAEHGTEATDAQPLPKVTDQTVSSGVFHSESPEKLDKSASVQETESLKKLKTFNADESKEIGAALEKVASLFGSNEDRRLTSAKRDKHLIKSCFRKSIKHKNRTAKSEPHKQADTTVSREKLADEIKSLSIKNHVIDNKCERKTKGKRGRKRKQPLEKKISPNITPPQPSSKDRVISTETDTVFKREKRFRKSEAEYEDFHGWIYDDFSSTEPENDDSEDEDFHCPITSNLSCGRQQKLQAHNIPVRHSSRRSLGLFAGSGLLDEHPSVGEKSRLKKCSAAVSSLPLHKKLKTSTPKGDIPKPRRGRKPKKLSSQSTSSVASLNRKADSKSKSKVKRKKKRMRVLSSDKEDLTDHGKPPLKLRKKYQRKKKAINLKKICFKTDLATILSERKYPKRLVTDNKRLEAISKSFSLGKTKMVKLKTKHVEKDDSTNSKNSTKRKLQKRLLSKSNVSSKEELESNSAMFPNEVINSPRPVASIELKINTLDPTVQTAVSSNREPAMARSLIELYTGTHATKSTTSKKPTQPFFECKVAESELNDNQLFENDLTERETQVLNALFQKASDELDKTQCITNVENTERRCVANKLPSASSVIATPDHIPSETTRADVNNPFTTEIVKTSTPEKVKKKRGRKPKAFLNQILNTSNANAFPKKLHKPDLSERRAFTFLAKTHLKVEDEENAIDTKAKATAVVGRARRGRPPGSRNKNKLRKFPVKKVSKSLKKKYVKRCHALLQRNLERKATTTSPCTSIARTPSSFKSRSCFSKSRISTPSANERRILHLSSFPPSMKKLTCNSAIGETVLHKAARFGYLDYIQHYLQQGFDVNVKDNAGYTALHEACVQGKLEAAKILLEFGADVNINSEDGTRPIHDAVEHDRVEMARLLLACGADPSLSKFSGRSVRDMIRSDAMGTFLRAYLKELKPIDEEVANDRSSPLFPVSSIFDLKEGNGCDSLANPPSEDVNCDDMVFEFLEQEPLDSYLVQAEELHGRANYYLLLDILRKNSCSRSEFLLDFPVDIKNLIASSLSKEVFGNWVRKKNPSISTEQSEPSLELVCADKIIESARAYRIDRTGKVAEEQTNHSSHKSWPKHCPKGAFCEQAYVAANCNFKNGENNTAMSYEDNPGCSSSTSQSFGDFMSPLSFDSHSTPRDAKTSHSLPHFQAAKQDMTELKILKQESCEKKSFQKVSSFNGSSSRDMMCNGYSPTYNELTPLKLTDEGLKTANSCPSSSYSPTWDLHPIHPLSNDPNRVLTETENAVLSLTMDKKIMFDTDLSMIQLSREKAASLSKLCEEATKNDARNNGRQLNHSNESETKSFTHVSESRKEKGVIL